MKTKKIKWYRQVKPIFFTGKLLLNLKKNWAIWFIKIRKKIFPHIGANWIDEEYYYEFVEHLIGETGTSGDEKAAYELSKMYYYGEEVPEDEKKSSELAEIGIDWFDSGDYSEQLMFLSFAKMYRYGTNGIEKNMTKAVEWYENIIFHFGYEEDVVLDLAQIYIEGNYFYGNGVEKDIYKAAWWFANIYEVYDYIDSDLVIGISEKIHHGEGIAKDIDKAINWYQNFFTYDENEEIMYLLGEIYFEIDNIDSAIEYYEKAADKGNVKAMYRLAGIYLYGESVEKNLSESLEWIDKISEILNQEIKSK